MKVLIGDTQYAIASRDKFSRAVASVRAESSAKPGDEDYLASQEDFLAAHGAEVLEAYTRLGAEYTELEPVVAEAPKKRATRKPAKRRVTKKSKK